MRYIFISGIPTSGKSYLAKKVAKAIGVLHFEIDKWREKIKDDNIKKWVNFYFDQDEEKYYKSTSCDEQWENLKKQSEIFWPKIKSKIDGAVKLNKPAIFEGVNILPHLAARDLDFPGIYLLGNSFEEIFERNKREPRWGNTEKLQKMEAKSFFYCERPRYKKEAEKYGFKTFENIDEAEKEVIRLLTK